MDNLFLKYLNYQILKKDTNNHFLNFNELFEQCYVVGTRNKAKYSDQVINILNNINVKNIQNIHGYAPESNNKFLLKGELSYYEAWIKILKNANSKILIFDDDIRLMYNFQMNFSKLFQNVPHDWDIVYLGASQHSWEDVDCKGSIYKGIL